MQCKLKNCYLPVAHINYCNKHYLQQLRHGKTFITRNDRRPAIIEDDYVKIPLGVGAKDGYVLVDRKYEYLANDNWRKTFYGYAVRSKDHQLMHRIILNAQRGAVVDHINGDKLDNRAENIRVCTQAQNMKNQKKKANRSGFKGVTIAPNGKYIARIVNDYKRIRIGTFSTAIDAAQAYDEAAVKYHGKFARLNNG